jgi:hypothetical protein
VFEAGEEVMEYNELPYCRYSVCVRIQCMEYNELPYCRRDFLELFAAHCSGCGGPLTPEEVASGDCVAMGTGLQFHKNCVQCAHCTCDLGPGSTEVAVLKQPEAQLYCKTDFIALFAPKCAKCDEPIEGRPLKAMGKSWHKVSSRRSTLQTQHTATTFPLVLAHK